MNRGSYSPALASFIRAIEVRKFLIYFLRGGSLTSDYVKFIVVRCRK